jgi:hypothetical protein
VRERPEVSAKGKHADRGRTRRVAEWSGEWESNEERESGSNEPDGMDENR